MDTSLLSTLFINTTNDLIFLLKVEGAEPPYTFRFASVNPSYLSTTGFSEDLVGRTPEEMLPADVVPFVLSQFTNAVSAGRPIKYEEPVRFNGTPLIVETSLHPFYDPAGAPQYLLGVTRDITERKAQERTIRESEHRYRTLVQLSPDSILIHDNGTIVFCNEAAARLIEAERPEDLLGRKLYEFVHPDHRRALELRLLRLSHHETGDIPPLETKLVKRGGGMIDVEATSAFVERDGKRMLQVILRDVTKRSLEKKRLQRLSQLDGLTNIANRRHFDLMLNREVNRARRNKLPISLILFDLDNFKHFNDEYGHLIGDDCLKKVTESAKELLKRPGDLLARFGGEEFAVLLPETDNYGAAIVAEQLRSCVEQLAIPHEKSDYSVVTISLGVASMTRPSTSDIVPFIERADRALYMAKRNGKNRVQLSIAP